MSNYRVSAHVLELRTGPGTQSPILTQLRFGTLVESLSPPDLRGWMLVRALRNGRRGWLASTYLEYAPDNVMGADAWDDAPPSQAGKEDAVSCPDAPEQSGPGDLTQALVFDVSHFNGRVDFDAAYRGGLRAVIIKATEGTRWVDPRFHENRAKAEAAGLLVGAYHFGTGDDPVAQADHFLAILGQEREILPVLDLETNPQGHSMRISQAMTFVEAIAERTEHWPGLYSGSYVRDVLGSRQDPVLGCCWLWVAEYGPRPRVQATWKGWTLWQYTDGHHGDGPHRVPGVQQGCDRSRFAGDGETLETFWRANC
jgi:lysozyme